MRAFIFSLAACVMGTGVHADSEVPHNPKAPIQIVVQAVDGHVVETHAVKLIDQAKRLGISEFYNTTLWLMVADDSNLDFLVLNFNSWSEKQNLENSVKLWSKLTSSTEPVTIYISETGFGVEAIEKVRTSITIDPEGKAHENYSTRDRISHNWWVDYSDAKITSKGIFPLRLDDYLKRLEVSEGNYPYWSILEEPFHTEYLKIKSTHN